MAKKGYRVAFRHPLKQAQGEFLAMVLDGLVALVGAAAVEQFGPVQPGIRRPGDFLKAAEELFAGAEIWHPDIVTVLGQTPTAATNASKVARQWRSQAASSWATASKRWASAS